jgi:hypothetical protein
MNLEGRPGADHFPMAGQVLRMNVNGRLTAPPQLEVRLVTNSVDGIVSEGRNDRPEARGTTLANWSFGNCSRTRILRGAVRVSAGALYQAQVLGKFDPVSAAHFLSAREAAAGS